MKRPDRFTFRSSERLRSRKDIQQLFTKGNKSLLAYPLRAVIAPSGKDGVSILISVSKRHFKRAVKRNRVKRQIREAYRTSKALLDGCDRLNIAFLWLSDELLPTEIVRQKVRNLLIRCAES